MRWWFPFFFFLIFCRRENRTYGAKMRCSKDVWNDDYDDLLWLMLDLKSIYVRNWRKFFLFSRQMYKFLIKNTIIKLYFSIMLNI